MIPRASAAVVLALAACGPVTAHVPDDLAAHGVYRIPLEVGKAHGLSGLAVAADGGVWTIAERAATAFRIDLDLTRSPPTVRAIEPWPVVGLPPGEELESLAILPDGAMMVGAEGRAAHVVHAYRLEKVGHRLEVRGPAISMKAKQLGVHAGGNHGAEGACAVPGLTLFAIEAAGQDAVSRWAPLVVLHEGGPDGDDVTQAAALTPDHVRHLRLTTATGKISALDCWRDGDRVRVIAIERHFAVTRILGFDLDDGAGDLPIAPTVLRDLAPVLHGSLNLEGLVRLPDGHLLAVVDNQYGTLTGPDELIWFADVPSW